MFADILLAVPLGILLAFTIGPVFFVLLETAITKGFRAAIAFNIGVVTADAAFISIVYFTTNSLLTEIKDDPRLFLAGGLIMMAYGLLSFIKVKKFFYNDSYLVQTLKNDGNINQEVDFRGINNDDFEEIIRNYDVLILEHPSFALPKSHLEFAQKFSDYLRYLERNKIEEGNK